jgi:hypothetical protein
LCEALDVGDNEASESQWRGDCHRRCHRKLANGFVDPNVSGLENRCARKRTESSNFSPLRFMEREPASASGLPLLQDRSSSKSSPPRQRRGDGEHGGTGVEEQGSRGFRRGSPQPQRERREAGGRAGGEQGDAPGCIAVEDRA